jgi:hypothetical protein
MYRKLWRSLLCFIGLHKWEQNRPLAIIDGFPPPGHYDTPKRRCTRPCCMVRQYWLPGYGGSEWGCWSPDPGR